MVQLGRPRRQGAPQPDNSAPTARARATFAAVAATSAGAVASAFARLPGLDTVLKTASMPRAWTRWASGPIAIDRAALLRYIVSFREHNDFHEACIERMFVDIAARCGTEQLSVFGRYQRRGGLDINPFRSDFEAEPAASRLWRQ